MSCWVAILKKYYEKISKELFIDGIRYSKSSDQIKMVAAAVVTTNEE